jgi:hypothetical protein
MTEIYSIVNILESKCLKTLYTPINTDRRLANERKVSQLDRKTGREEKKNTNYNNNREIMMNMIGNISNDMITEMMNNIANSGILENHQFDDMPRLVNVPTPLSNNDRKTLTNKNYSELKIDDINNREIDTECSICRMEYEHDSIITILPCDGKHYYHKECIGEWLEVSKKCPICKADIEDVIRAE